MGAVKKAELSEKEIHLIAKALADPRRMDMLRQIGRCSNAVSCGDIKDCHTVSAATMSHHMKELETAGLIQVIREGKFASYTLQREVLQAYLEQLAKI
jgi:ArsR family transcriptional regulator